MASLFRQGFGGRSKVGHQRMSEEAGGAVDDTFAKLTRPTDEKAHRQVHGHIVLRRRYIFAVRDGQQMQRHIEEQGRLAELFANETVRLLINQQVLDGD